MRAPVGWRPDDRSRHVAVDLGAGSGRVIAGSVREDRIELEPVHRFANRPVVHEGVMRWNLDELYAQTLRGIARATRAMPDDAVSLSVGIDSWAVDYCLLDQAGDVLDLPRHYRDPHILQSVARVHDRMSQTELYEATGTQFLPFNTVYQLDADRDALARARTLLLVPDAIACRLTGVIGAEVTNASTTGLFDVRGRRWSDEVIARQGIDRSLFAALHEPGTVVGPTLSPYGGRTSTVVRVASHDTASAVVAIPGAGDDWAFISSGTWSLVGVEIDRPIISDASRTGNFTNELGCDGTVRFLRNVAGMWLLQESLRSWNEAGVRWRLVDLLEAAEGRPSGATFDPDHPDLLARGDMPARIRRVCADSGHRPPGDEIAVVRAILDSLALRHAEVLDELEAITGRSIRTVHIVGGGSRNSLLCQLTADRSGRTVVAGPVEATAMGNVLVQARACGSIEGGLDDLRRVVRRSTAMHTYTPRPATSRGRR